MTDPISTAKVLPMETKLIYPDAEYTLPLHVSYSAFSTFITCGYQYYLSRIVKEKPAIWSLGGTAFHEAAEAWDRENL